MSRLYSHLISCWYFQDTFSLCVLCRAAVSIVSPLPPFPVPPNSLVFTLSSSPGSFHFTCLHLSSSLFFASFRSGRHHSILSSSSCFHHFSALPQLPSFVINLLCLPQISVSLPLLFTHFRPLIVPPPPPLHPRFLPQRWSRMWLIHSNTLFCSFIKLFSFSSRAVSLSFCPSVLLPVCVFFPFSLYLGQSLKVSDKWINCLSPDNNLPSTIHTFLHEHCLPLSTFIF